LEFISDSISTDAPTAPETINVSDGAVRARKGDSIKTYLNTFAKAIVPFAFLTVTTGMAHAAPSIDMSGVTSVMLTVQTACLLIGAIIVLISLVFSVFSFAGGNIMRGHRRGWRIIRRLGYWHGSNLDLIPYRPGGWVSERVRP
jgi:hypothetical protein